MIKRFIYILDNWLTVCELFDLRYCEKYNEEWLPWRL